MFGSDVLGVVIGLIFVYFVFSMIVSKLNEYVSAKLAWRARDLETWLRKTLDPPDPDDQPPISSEKFKESSLIASITPDDAKVRLPSYISPRTFSLAVLDLLCPEDQVTTVDQVKTALDGLPANHPAKAPLTRLAIEAGEDLAALRAGIEGWFNDSMARVSGWYKRRVQQWLVIYGLAITVFLNVDTILIARSLWDQDTVRDAVVAQAAQQAEAASAGGGTAGDPAQRAAELNDVSKRVAEVDRLGLPVGWAPEHKDGAPNPDPRRFPGWGWGLAVKALGLAITVGAISLGAPFWFDLLNKISKLRSAGDRPSTTPSQPTPTANQPVVVVQTAQAPA